MKIAEKLTILTTSIGFWLVATMAIAQNECATGKTIEPNLITIATGNPAYYPWVLNDTPESGEGFESAVAYEVAERMGFSREQVRWTSASFDQSIQPGAKNFDFNLQQFSITPERDEVVDFSVPYYSAAMAVLVRQAAVENGAEPTLESLKGLIWGADANTTALPMLEALIDPEREPLLYDDNTDVVEAMKANQIDAALFDLPTAMYLSAVSLDDGVVLGQFTAERGENPDQFGLLMEDGNPLKECLDAALIEMTNDGTLADIEATWLQQTTGVPVIK